MGIWCIGCWNQLYSRLNDPVRDKQGGCQAGHIAPTASTRVLQNLCLPIRLDYYKKPLFIQNGGRRSTAPDLGSPKSLFANQVRLL